MEESHNFYLNDYTEFVKQATDIIESNKNSKNYVGLGCFYIYIL